MWETPIYKFKKDVNGEPKEILIDVTGSAPSFEDPGKQLEVTFHTLLSGLEPEKTKILDFGAAKLRNSISSQGRLYGLFLRVCRSLQAL